MPQPESKLKDLGKLQGETLEPSLDQPQDLAEAVQALRQGQLVGMPTETVYGLAADGTQLEAVRSIFRLKGRPTGHPLILHFAQAQDILPYVESFPARAERAARFWPGPLTLILKRSPLVPLEVTGGRDTVAVRVPAHPVAQALIRGLGRPIAAPSANRFGRVSPTTREHVRSEFGAALPLVLEGGACQVGLESTILDLSREHCYLLRPGGITPEQLAEALGEPILASDGAVVAPGCLDSHYAPSAQVVLVPSEELEREAQKLLQLGKLGLLLSEAPSEALRQQAELCLIQGDKANFARELYAGLRELDSRACRYILSPIPELTGLGLAIMDRLKRAAAPRPGA